MRKLCVGVETVDWLEARLARAAEGRGYTSHVTRSWPKRSEELLAGGSLYWIVKGVMQARQPILRFEEFWPSDSDDDRPRCRIVLEAELVRTDPWPHRPFQGWRYLKAEEAPPDISAVDGDDSLPPDLAVELKNMGVL